MVPTDVGATGGPEFAACFGSGRAERSAGLSRVGAGAFTGSDAGAYQSLAGVDRTSTPPTSVPCDEWGCQPAESSPLLMWFQPKDKPIAQLTANDANAVRHFNMGHLYSPNTSSNPACRWLNRIEATKLDAPADERAAK